MLSEMADETSVEATVDLSAVRANALEASRLSGGRELIAVVKADAYGHGAVEVARALLEVGCRSLAVVTVEEAAQLRSAALVAPILVLGGPRSPEEADLAVALQLTLVLHHADSLELAVAAARRAHRSIRVQVEIDTGMSRMGVPDREALEFLERIDKESSLELGGAFTHFSSADQKDLEPSLEQLRRFRGVLEAAHARGIHPASIHVANSAGVVAGTELADALPEATAIRPGLMLYGVKPSAQSTAELRPVMCLRARVARIQDLHPGETVGYGATYSVPGRGNALRVGSLTRIATLPLGYADGIPCSTGNRGWVWLEGARRPIAGRVSMDSIGVDVGSANVDIGDEAVIFGNAESAESGISVEESASWAETIPYELLVRVGRRVPRRFVG